jgi:regulator of sigma E protease
MSLIVIRNREQLKVELTPRQDPPANQGRLGVSIIPLSFNQAYGVAFAEANLGPVVREDLGTAINSSLAQTTFMFRTILEAPVRILRGEISGEEGRVVSPIGIAQISSEVIRVSSSDQTPYRILQFIATISIALGITNLLPIPGLDGGRILFVIIELIRGKPINPEAEGWVHTIGLVLLLGLVALIAINDIVNPIGPLLGR